MGGIVCVKDEEIGKRIAFVQNAEGAGLAPFDAWLILRGMKTMALRMARAQVRCDVIRQIACEP
jgi:cystathionine beta-lyase